MLKTLNSRTYIIVKNRKEVELAKKCDLCMHIIMEVGNIIHMWDSVDFKWIYKKYTAFGEEKYKDDETTGREAYYKFYKYCGKSEIERMKTLLTPISAWESEEQMHYCNLSYCGTKIYEDIYEFDVNSSFNYGATRLPGGFELLSSYMIDLFEQRKNSTDEKEKARLKNLSVYLVGYFIRIKEFVAVRSKIIENSNSNVRIHIAKILQNNGIVFLSNTDSIVTNTKGAEVMLPLVSEELGKFKLSTYTDKLFYNSPNSYQLGDGKSKKIRYSGVSYFARQHTDFFKDEIASSKGKLIEGYDFKLIELSENSMYDRVCKVRNGEIVVTIFNKLGEELNKIIYKLGD